MATAGTTNEQGFSFAALLEQAERDALLPLGIVRSFPRGTTLMFEQEPGERVMLLLVGRVKVTRAGDDGAHELLLSIRCPGDLLGELSFIDGEPRVATVTALEPVQALVIPAATFRDHLERTPRVAVVLLEVVSRRFREATRERLQLAALDTMGRVAARIAELAERFGEEVGGAVSVALPISQDELAEWAGASRAGVAHALQTMRELAWISTGRRRITVRDLEAVRSRGTA